MYKYNNSKNNIITKKIQELGWETTEKLVRLLFDTTVGLSWKICICALAEKLIKNTIIDLCRHREVVCVWRSGVLFVIWLGLRAEYVRMRAEDKSLREDAVMANISPTVRWKSPKVSGDSESTI